MKAHIGPRDKLLCSWNVKDEDSSSQTISKFVWYEPSFPPTKELHCWIVSECDEFVVLLAWNLSLSCTLTPLWNQVMVGLGSAMIAQWNTRVEPSSSWRMVGLDANVGAMPSTCLHKKDICGLVQSYRAPVANLIKHITIVNYDAGVVLTTYLPILQL